MSQKRKQYATSTTTKRSSYNSASASSQHLLGPLRLGSFPQDVTLRILTFLPLSSLAQVAQCSRRFKVMAYNDVLYLRKFSVWHYKTNAPLLANAASASLMPNGTLPVPLHLTDAWARFSSARGLSPPALPTASIGLLPGQQLARDVFRSIYVALAPFYFMFRLGSDRGAKRILDGQNELVDQAMYFALVKQFGRAALVDDFALINQQIQTGLQIFESQLLSSFDRYYDANDIPNMQRLANCLFLLNGGDSCVQQFIYKSPIFFDHIKDVTENFKAFKVPAPRQAKKSTASPPDSAFTHSLLTSPENLLDADLATDSSPLQRYLDTMSSTLETQLPLIRTVFPHAVASQYAFVQKVFDECILDYLTRLLREAQSRDLAIFLMSLTLMFEHCSDLLRHLADEHALDASKLEDFLHTTLRPFTGNEYMARELTYLKTTYAKFLDAWSTTLAARRANIIGRGGNVKVTVPDPHLGNRVLSSVKNVLLTPSALMHRVVSRGSYMPTLALTGNSASVSPDDQPPMLFSPTEAFDQLDSLLSVDMVLNMISLNKESVKRCVVMMKRSGDMKLHVERLFSVLTQTVSDRHIKVSFNIATDRLSSYKASEDLEVLPLIQFFSMIQVVDVILQMVHMYFTEEIGHYINQNDFLGDAIQEKKKFEKVIDDCVATGLDRAMITLMSQAEFLLYTEQHPLDFEPTDDLVADVRPTDACRLSVACLNKHIEMLRVCAERNILAVFLGEIGNRFFSVLCKHIKRQRISVPGGFRLMCDINAYHAWAETLRNGEVSRMFKALKEMANIYVVTDLPALKQLVKDQNRFVGIFRVEDVYEFIERRSDYEKIKSKVKESECCVM